MTTKGMMQKPCQVLNVFFKLRLQQQQMEDTLSSHSNPHPPYFFSLPQDVLMTVSKNLPYTVFFDMETQTRGLQRRTMKYRSNNSRAQTVVIMVYRNQSVEPNMCLSLKHWSLNILKGGLSDAQGILCLQHSRAHKLWVMDHEGIHSVAGRERRSTSALPPHPPPHIHIHRGNWNPVFSKN